jgi:hypothetical protein
MDQTPGAVTWRDLTVPDAETVSAFYEKVVGWKREPLSMGDYNDFNMNDFNGATAAGVCHARGPNANLPPQWLIYINVADVEKSASTCKELGGTVLEGPRPMGDLNFAVIQDPAGAVAAIVSPR